MCVAATHFRAHVEQALLITLDNQAHSDGARGFFHPDNFTFDQPLYLSQLYAAVEAVEGVDAAVVTKFKRLQEPDAASPDNLDQAHISIGTLEIVRLDNGPSFPANGVLRLNMLGGK